jgi:hypothetical protein
LQGAIFTFARSCEREPPLLAWSLLAALLRLRSADTESVTLHATGPTPEELSANAEEMSAGAQEFSALATGLQEIVERFTLDATETALPDGAKQNIRAIRVA